MRNNEIDVPSTWQSVRKWVLAVLFVVALFAAGILFMNVPVDDILTKDRYRVERFKSRVYHLKEEIVEAWTKKRARVDRRKVVLQEMGMDYTKEEE